AFAPASRPRLEAMAPTVRSLRPRRRLCLLAWREVSRPSGHPRKACVRAHRLRQPRFGAVGLGYFGAGTEDADGAPERGRAHAEGRIYVGEVPFTTQEIDPQRMPR